FENQFTLQAKTAYEFSYFEIIHGERGCKLQATCRKPAWLILIFRKGIDTKLNQRNPFNLLICDAQSVKSASKKILPRTRGFNSLKVLG
ncbi:MAG: hypothetical protein ACJ749_12415, partial [Flavisolibacter sp.]